MHVDRRRPRRSPTPDRAGLAERAARVERVELASAGRKPPTGPPTSTALSFLADPAEAVEQPPQRRAQRTSTMPGLPTAPVSLDEHRAGLRRPHRSSANAADAIGHDPRHGGQRLDVVDDGRLAPQALRRSGRAAAGRAGARLFSMRAQQDGLLADDEAALAARASRRAGRSRRRARRCPGSPPPRRRAMAALSRATAVVGLARTATYAARGADRVGGQCDALQDGVRVASP